MHAQKHAAVQQHVGQTRHWILCDLQTRLSPESRRCFTSATKGKALGYNLFGGGGTSLSAEWNPKMWSSQEKGCNSQESGSNTEDWASSLKEHRTRAAVEGELWLFSALQLLIILEQYSIFVCLMTVCVTLWRKCISILNHMTSCVAQLAWLGRIVLISFHWKMMSKQLWLTIHANCCAYWMFFKQLTQIVSSCSIIEWGKLRNR